MTIREQCLFLQEQYAAKVITAQQWLERLQELGEKTRGTRDHAELFYYAVTDATCCVCIDECERLEKAAILN